jgi:hypothetical protein
VTFSFSKMENRKAKQVLCMGGIGGKEDVRKGYKRAKNGRNITCTCM